MNNMHPAGFELFKNSTIAALDRKIPLKQLELRLRLFYILWRRRQKNTEYSSAFGETEASMKMYDGGRDSYGRFMKNVWTDLAELCVRAGLDPRCFLIGAVYDSRKHISYIFKKPAEEALDASIWHQNIAFYKFENVISDATDKLYQLRNEPADSELLTWFGSHVNDVTICLWHAIALLCKRGDLADKVKLRSALDYVIHAPMCRPVIAAVCPQSDQILNNEAEHFIASHI